MTSSLLYSASWKDHLRNLEGVLTCLLEAGLKVKLSKSVFGRKYMSYLGHQVGNGKFAVPLYRVKSMKRYGKPQTKKQLRAFLGSIGYYRQFVRNKWSSVLTPTMSLSVPPQVVQWKQKVDSVFSELCNVLWDCFVVNALCVSDYLFNTQMPQDGVSI